MNTTTRTTEPAEITGLSRGLITVERSYGGLTVYIETEDAIDPESVFRRLKEAWLVPQDANLATAQIHSAGKGRRLFITWRKP